MSTSKIDFSFDNLHFSCEGDKDWVESQFKQLLGRISGLNKPDSVFKSEGSKPSLDKDTNEGVLNTEVKEKGRRGRKPKVVTQTPVDELAGDPLFLFLKEKAADKNQVKKFLATAVFLHSQGEEKFSTSAVSKALKASHIEKLLNASDCLNKNEKKGFCIKDDKEFILTELGIRSIIE